MSDESKPVWQSKTVWANVFAAVLPLVPNAQSWISNNAEMYSALVGLANIGLRAITEKKVSWSWKF